MGDRLRVPEGVQQAFLRAGSGEEIAVKAGDEIVLEVEEDAGAPGVRSRVLAGGREVARADDRLKVAVRWSSTEVRALRPKTETQELELEPGEEREIDLQAAYTPLPGTTLEGVETRVRLTGPDAEKMNWIPSEPPRNGRARGKVVARRD
jgi:hypothetical protein